MDYHALHTAAETSLRQCEDRPRRLTLLYLLIAYAAAAAVEVALLFTERAIEGAEGFAALEIRDRYLFWSTAATVLLAVFSNLWSIGYENAALRVSRGQRVGFSDLAAGMRMFGQFVLLYLLKLILIGLWSALLFIPGIVAAYRYRLAEKLMLDDPSLSPLAAIRLSKQMTYGHKLELFVLDLTFWLHYLLVFLLEYSLDILEAAGVQIVTVPLRLACYFGATALLLLVELHKLPEVQTTYAHAYDWIRTCNDANKVL